MQREYSLKKETSRGISEVAALDTLGSLSSNRAAK